MRIGIICLFIFTYSAKLSAQSWLHLRYSNLFGGNSYNAVVPTGSFLGTALYWSGTTPIQLKVTHPTFVNNANSSYTFNASNILAQIDNIGGNAPGGPNFQGTLTPPTPLAATPISLFYPLGGLFDNRPTGAVNIRYTINNAAILSTTWRQGEYNNIREYTTYTSGFLRYFSPISDHIFVEVDAILAWLQSPTGGGTSIPNSIFDFFRNNQGLTVSYNGTLATTLPYRLSFRANSTAILKNGAPISPVVPLSSITVTGNDLSANRQFPTFALAGTAQELSAGTNINIGAQNRNKLNVTLNISKENLLRYFFLPGTYSLPAINLTASGTATATTYNEPGGVKNLSYDLPPVQFTIPSQQQVSLTNTSDVNFYYNSIENFSPAAEQSQNRSLILSSNIDYTLYVRAETPAFIGPNGATLPLDVIEISSATGDPNVRTIVLSNQSQVLVAPSVPILDRTVTLKYRIPSTVANEKLFGKPRGNYQGSIIYSFMAN